LIVPTPDPVMPTIQKDSAPEKLPI
jgi:hypothetical protein